MNPIRWIREEAIADKRKAALLGGLGLLSLVLGVRAIGFSDSKRPSRAAPVASAAIAGGAGETPTSVNASDEERRVRLAMDSWKAIRTADRSARDLFALDSAHFPDPSQADRPAGDSTKSESGYDDDGVDSLVIDRDAALIRLKSTMIGTRTVAIFDLTALGGPPSVIARVGDRVGGFRVSRIETGGVTLSRDGETRQLRVASPLD